MTIKKLLLSALLLAIALQATSQEVLTLDTCRARALRANTSLKQAEAKVDETHALERAALMQVLPKVSANGGYMWMEKSVNFLSEEQKERINHIGDNMEGDLLDHITAMYLMPIGGLLIVLFLGWRMKKKEVLDELSNDGTLRAGIRKVVYYIIRYLAPVAITIIFISQLVR